MPTFLVVDVYHGVVIRISLAYVPLHSSLNSGIPFLLGTEVFSYLNVTDVGHDLLFFDQK
jgi:hypothetical protein